MDNAGIGTVWDFGTPQHTMYPCYSITDSHGYIMSSISFSFCLHFFLSILLCHNQKQSKSQFYVLKTNPSFISGLIIHGLKVSKGLLDPGGRWEWGLGNTNESLANMNKPLLFNWEACKRTGQQNQGPVHGNQDPSLMEGWWTWGLANVNRKGSCTP